MMKVVMAVRSVDRRIVLGVVIFATLTFLYTLTRVPHDDGLPAPSIEKEVPAPAGASGPSGAVNVEKSPTANVLKIELDGNKCELNYITNEVNVEESKLHVLLLNGADLRLDEKIWKDIGTMEQLAKNKFAAAAVNVHLQDTEGCTNDHEEANAIVLHKIISQLKFDENKLVIISPSASGRFSLPYLLMSPGRKAKALVAVMPVIPSVPEYNIDEKYKTLKVKTLIVYGSDDTVSFKSESLQKLTSIPDNKVEVISGAGHQCYRQNPAEWHRILLDFLTSL